MHAWLAHIHPYIDGNGRTARAITNLELTRAGYPPIIIKKKERDRYIDALGEPDDGGDISAFLELIFERLEGTLTGLEISAKKMQGFNPLHEKLRLNQEKQLHIWEISVKLLASIIEHQLNSQLDALHGSCNFRIFEAPLDLDDYIEVCQGHSVTKSWAFMLVISVPGLPSVERLAYIGHRSARVHQFLGREGGPSLYWSIKNPTGFPKWINNEEDSPYAVELTTRIGKGDEWYIRTKNDQTEALSTTELASKISEALISILAG